MCSPVSFPTLCRAPQRDPIAAGKAATVDAAIGSYLGVPLTLGNGRVYGALCVSSHSAHFELGPAAVAFMNFLARLVADELTEQEREEAARAVHVRELTAWLAPGGRPFSCNPSSTWPAEPSAAWRH